MSESDNAPGARENPAFHPVAGIFPEMDSGALASLAVDIGTHGLREPIWTRDGAIIDGRNRYRACLLAFVEPAFREYIGPAEELVGFVVSLNLHRRHLSESQRAMVAAKLANLGQGARTDLRPIGRKSQAEAADLLQVGERTVRRAAAVLDHGAEGLASAVAAGKVSAHMAAAIAGLPEETQRAALALGEKGLKDLARDVRARRQIERRAERLARNEALAAGAAPAGELAALGRTFAVIYADPPWKHEVINETTGYEKAAENHYPTMTVDAIQALPVGAIAAENAALFLWTTAPHLADAIDTMRAWGFAYKSRAVWDKIDFGTGYWFRDDAEILLLGTRGDVPAPVRGTQARALHREKKGAHSAKPEFYRELIDAYFPGVAKIELFGRGEAPAGWTLWGFEAVLNREAAAVAAGEAA